jgi:hypothetical protein
LGDGDDAGGGVWGNAASEKENAAAKIDNLMCSIQAKLRE